MAAVHRPDIASVGAPPAPHRIANDKCPYGGAGNTEHPPPITLQHQQAANDHYYASDDAERPIPSTHGSTHILMALLAKLTASIRLHTYVLWTFPVSAVGRACVKTRWLMSVDGVSGDAV